MRLRDAFGIRGHRQGVFDCALPRESMSPSLKAKEMPLNRPRLVQTSPWCLRCRKNRVENRVDGSMAGSSTCAACAAALTAIWTYAERWLARREETRARIAKFINAEPDEVAFTTNTSSGMNVIVDALQGHGEVISSELEFPVLGKITGECS